MVLQRLGGGRALVSPWEEMGAMGSVGDILVMEAINQPLFICQHSKGQLGEIVSMLIVRNLTLFRIQGDVLDLETATQIRLR